MADKGLFDIQIVMQNHTGKGFLSKLEGYMHKEFVKAEKDIRDRLLKSAREETHRYKHQTRNLRNATKVKGELTMRKGLVLYVDLNQADYGKYIIGGHGTWEPDPYIEKAVTDNEQWIQNRIQKAVDSAVIAFNRM